MTTLQTSRISVPIRRFLIPTAKQVVRHATRPQKHCSPPATRGHHQHNQPDDVLQTEAPQLHQNATDDRPTRSTTSTPQPHGTSASFQHQDLPSQRWAVACRPKWKFEIIVLASNANTRVHKALLALKKSASEHAQIVASWVPIVLGLRTSNVFQRSPNTAQRAHLCCTGLWCSWILGVSDTTGRHTNHMHGGGGRCRQRPSSAASSPSAPLAPSVEAHSGSTPALGNSTRAHEKGPTTARHRHGRQGGGKFYCLRQGTSKRGEVQPFLSC